MSNFWCVVRSHKYVGFAHLKDNKVDFLHDSTSYDAAYGSV